MVFVARTTQQLLRDEARHLRHTLATVFYSSFSAAFLHHDEVREFSFKLELHVLSSFEQHQVKLAGTTNTVALNNTDIIMAVFN